MNLPCFKNLGMLSRTPQFALEWHGGTDNNERAHPNVGVFFVVHGHLADGPGILLLLSTVLFYKFDKIGAF